MSILDELGQRAKSLLGAVGAVASRIRVGVHAPMHSSAMNVGPGTQVNNFAPVLKAGEIVLAAQPGGAYLSRSCVVCVRADVRNTGDKSAFITSARLAWNAGLFQPQGDVFGYVEVRTDDDAEFAGAGSVNLPGNWYRKLYWLFPINEAPLRQLWDGGGSTGETVTLRLETTSGSLVSPFKLG